MFFCGLFFVIFVIFNFCRFFMSSDFFNFFVSFDSLWFFVVSFDFSITTHYFSIFNLMFHSPIFVFSYFTSTSSE